MNPIGCNTWGCAPITAVAPARSVASAKARWREVGTNERSTPQWKVATTTSACRRARRTPERIAPKEANCVPARPRPARNEYGRMSEKPTKAIRSPSRRTTTGRAAPAASRPAPTAAIPKRWVQWRVSRRAPGPKSPEWLFARFTTSRPPARRAPRSANGRPRKVKRLWTRRPYRETAHSRFANARSARRSTGPTEPHG